MYSVSADFVNPVPEEISEKTIDDDSLSVASSEQDFNDAGISEISNQESKIAYHKSLMDSLQIEDEFTEWLLKERLLITKNVAVELDPNNNNIENTLNLKQLSTNELSLKPDSEKFQNSSKTFIELDVPPNEANVVKVNNGANEEIPVPDNKYTGTIKSEII